MSALIRHAPARTVPQGLLGEKILDKKSIFGHSMGGHGAHASLAPQVLSLAGLSRTANMHLFAIS
eukprot:1037494-Pleurochrysis_carterae.AAC.2